MGVMIEISLPAPEWGTTPFKAWVAHSDGRRAATLVTTKQQGGARMNDGATGAR